MSQLIANSLTPIILLDPSKVQQENGIAKDVETGLAISPQVASVVQYILDLINQQDMSDNDKKAVKSILDIVTNSLQNIINQLGSKLDKQTKQVKTVMAFNKAIDTLDVLKWYELKSKVTNIFSAIYS
ncbi:MAG: hypothetical protein HDS68_02425 [Bacteroidales bacterium]|nr:hypothetical protein [Bacteroidales bacterium]